MFRSLREPEYLQPSFSTLTFFHTVQSLYALLSVIRCILYIRHEVAKYKDPKEGRPNGRDVPMIRVNNPNLKGISGLCLRQSATLKKEYAKKKLIPR